MTGNQQNPSAMTLGAQIHHLLEQQHEIVTALHNSASRSQAESALTPITSADEALQLAFVKALAKAQEVDAADLLLAINELAPLKAARKEAKRALIQLAGRKIYPSWTPAQEQPAVLPAVAPPRFWKGQVTLMREQGEVQLTLLWEQGYEYGETRLLSFLLDYWRAGVKDFYTETGGKRHIEEHINELTTRFNRNVSSPITMTDCTLAEGRRLIEEALAINAWRKTSPHKDYRHYLPTIQQLIFQAPQPGIDRGLTFIKPGLEPDEVAAHFLGGWSLGDFGLCYDLLTRDSAILEGLSRDEWVARRRAWSDEAHPSFFDMNVLHEREQSSSALWLPGSYLSTRGRREVEACWTLELQETPLSGTLPEMAMGTTVLKETGRHWFWTSYVLTQEEGQWRISSIIDEGAKAQGLPVAELKQRVEENADAVHKITQAHQPTDPDARTYAEEIFRRSSIMLYYQDALLVKLPLDYDQYAAVAANASSLGLSERLLAYLQKWGERFAQDPRSIIIFQQIGATASLLASQYDEAGLTARAERFYELAEQTLQGVLERDKSALSYLLLAESEIMYGKFDEAEKLLKQGLAASPERPEEAQIENDLANIATERGQTEEALRHLLRAAELAPDMPDVWFNVAHAYHDLKNFAEAEVYYKRAIAENPHDIRAYAELGAHYLRESQYDKAYVLIEEAVYRNPTSAHLRALLAGILVEKGEIRRAQAMLQEAERINPDLEIVQAMRKAMESVKKR